MNYKFYFFNQIYQFPPNILSTAASTFPPVAFNAAILTY